MTVSIDNVMLGKKYLRDPYAFAYLVRRCRRHVRRSRRINEYLEADLDEALDLLESLYAIHLEQE